MSAERRHDFREWCVVQPAREAARFRLICFPYAGGGPTAFHGWADALPGAIELCALRLPGRGIRLREPAVASMPELVAVLADVIAPELSAATYGFFGHSLGARVAFELTRELERRRLPLPAKLWLSASRAPQLPPRRAPIHELPDAEFLAELRRYEGAPAEVFANHELMAIYAPIVRADLALHDTYTHQPGPPLAVPMSALGGVDDPYVLSSDLEAWSEHTISGFDVQSFPGGHFFVNASRALLLDRLSRDLDDLTSSA